ncbi:hypothetical protein Cgig2_004554 [Carnegiea gigantea]|uniref:Uncharacterized protein n=1 Tax=Carnegiea gigantea TaxID=171969 RepID=A0A9Q1GFQ6_9CARY|nr:hypothetical protein Cgig2_004554 [Carnegiea gigantea]
MRYLGVPITTSKLSKFECYALVEKITGKIKQWSTRNVSFAGRGQLINTGYPRKHPGHDKINLDGYHWLLGVLETKDWSKVIWARAVTPRHAFIMSMPYKVIDKAQNAKGERQATYAIVAAAIYSIWRARNEKVFSNHMIHLQTQSKLTKEHIIQRTLTLNSIIGKYTNCIDKILG